MFFMPNVVDFLLQGSLVQHADGRYCVLHRSRNHHASKGTGGANRVSR